MRTAGRAAGRPVARVAVALAAVVLGGGWVVAAAAPALAASWSWPGSPVVTRPFAPPAHRYGAGHRGVDLAATPGAPVRAAGPGRVSYAGLLAGRGVVVVVHGALRTTYEPVAASVGLGAAVAGGEVIGTLEAGHAGCPAPACLHWGLRRGEEYLDPLRLVEPGPVRLLPVGAGPGGAGRGGAGPGAAGPAGAQQGLAEARAAPAGATGPPPGFTARPTAGSSGTTDGSAPRAPEALLALGTGAVLAGAALRRRP